MDRLKVALVLPAVAGVSLAVWFSGLAYPLLTQAWSVLAPRPETDNDEHDLVG